MSQPRSTIFTGVGLHPPTIVGRFTPNSLVMKKTKYPLTLASLVPSETRETKRLVKQ